MADLSGMDVAGGIINFFTDDFNEVDIWGVGLSLIHISEPTRPY